MEEQLKQNIERTLGHPINNADFELFSSYAFSKSFEKRPYLLTRENIVSMFILFSMVLPFPIMLMSMAINMQYNLL